MSNRLTRLLYLCGMIAPLLFTFTAILGASLRPGYSRMLDTISELFSPGSPPQPDPGNDPRVSDLICSNERG
jgi:hypothetical protein